MIYFIQCGDLGPIKIGYATDVDKRLSALQSANPVELKLLLSLDGDRLDEKYYHSLFFNHIIRGEWFEPCEVLLKFIDEKNIDTDNHLIALTEPIPGQPQLWIEL